MKSINVKRAKDNISDIVVRLLPDKLYLQMVYRRNMGQRLNLKNPVTFQEKIQWLKLYNRRPEYTRMVDKYAVKKYVESVIGAEYIIPTLGVWNRAEEIDFESLPDKFVLKTTHDSGGVVVCRDKATLDKMATIKMLRERLKHNIFYHTREWPYKNVTPRIIAEKFLENSGSNDLVDYKVYCFGGRPEFIQVIQNRTTEETIDFFDMDWNHQEFVGLNPHCNNALRLPRCEIDLKRIRELTEKLSIGIPFVRIDFYNVNGKIYFGEITFFPASGLGIFSPGQWNATIGQMIDLEGYRGG